MDGQGNAAQSGPNGRRLHIAHRRSPSEMTPLMMEQLALAQQIEMLQQQQQQIAATHQQYVSMGMIPQQQQLTPQYQQLQGQMQGLNLSPQSAFQLPQGQQQLGIPPSTSPVHRRNLSAMPNMGMGPPPAPSSGASGFGDFSYAGAQRGENGPPRGRGGSAAGSGHTRRHSLALPEAKKAAELAEAKRKSSGFQFPIPGTTGSSSSASNRSVSPANPDLMSSVPGSASNHLSATSRSSLGSMRGHGRSQSMAIGSGRGMGASSRGGPVGFQFPAPQPSTDSTPQFEVQRSGSTGHGRQQSRNFDGNWRQPQPPTINEPPQQQNMGNFALNNQMGMGGFQPGHRSRGSVQAQSINSLAGFQYQPQPQLVQLPQGQVVLQQPSIFPGQQLNALQLAQIQAYQQAGIQPNLAAITGSQHNAPSLPGQGGNQAQRKTLFTPYLPQATLPALLADGQLVAGTLRVNKKNRSDAYVTTTDLDADIFICGSKDRNRALEGDLVAVELLDVDEVWGQKREKEEKKKRKDVSDRNGNVTVVNDATTQPETAQDGGIRRRGSLKQRPTQKKNDDVEVEGQSLLLMEEDEINDEQKPLYAGHIVAVVERVPGQMFSGTLGLLRPSSQATKEKQEAERAAREGSHHRQPERQQERPKIVWFKPTDKRVPLIAIPTEQAPKDFIERHQDYANKIFVACIKRWPITSLHPFGTLVEQLGEAGDLKVETDALLRDNNFGPDEFSDAVLRNVGHDDWTLASDAGAAEGRRDFRDEETFTIDPNGSNELDDAIHFKELPDGEAEIGMHVADVAHFMKPNTLVDREAKKRGTGVYLMDRSVNMLPAKLSNDICCLKPGEDRLTISVVFRVNAATGRVLDEHTWIGKSLIKSSGKLSYDQVDAVIGGSTSQGVDQGRADKILAIHNISQKFRQARFGGEEASLTPLRLLYQLDDENVPVEQNIFDSTPAHEMIEELSHKTNAYVASILQSALPEKALLRRQASPNPRRLALFAERMNNIGYDIDISTSAALQNSLFRIEDSDIRKGMETLVIKSMQRARYYVPAKISDKSLSHYALNLPLYTHFTNPSRRYADIVVHRQLEAVLNSSEGPVEYAEDLEALVKTAETCNTKKDSAFAAQEQSIHIESCRIMDRKAVQAGGELISVGIVVCVYESAFDVLLPEYGFEKRVHCDQLPLKKAEFNKDTRLLELYWEKGVPSSAFVPEDERPKPGNGRAQPAFSYHSRNQPSHDGGRHMNTGTIDTNDVDALFDDDDDDGASDVTGHAGVALNGDRNTQSGPPSPGRASLSPSRSKSDSRLLTTGSSLQGNGPDAMLTNKDKYFSMFALRQEGGDFIQDVREMTRVPILLKTDLGKSPPCLTIRSLNPYAL